MMMPARAGTKSAVRLPSWPPRFALATARRAPRLATARAATAFFYRPAFLAALDDREDHATGYSVGFYQFDDDPVRQGKGRAGAFADQRVVDLVMARSGSTRRRPSRRA
jgi:hypothetical protein